MLLVQSSVRPSCIAGMGLFVDQPVSKGSVVAIFTHGLCLINEEEYNSRTLAGDQTVIRTGCRFVDETYICRETEELEPEDYVNHSFSANLLYHCGICFALRDLIPDEELTVNYQYLLSEDEPGFFDVRTNRYVAGLSAHRSLYQSSLKLSALMKSCLEESKAEIVLHPVVRDVIERRKDRQRHTVGIR